MTNTERILRDQLKSFNQQIKDFSLRLIKDERLTDSERWELAEYIYTNDLLKDENGMYIMSENYPEMSCK